MFIDNHGEFTKSLVNEFLQVRANKNDKKMKDFFENENNQRHLMYEIFINLVKMKNDVLFLKCVKKMIDEHLDIDAFKTKNDLDIYDEIELLLNTSWYSGNMIKDDKSKEKQSK